MSTSETASQSGVQYISDEEAYEIFDYQARKLVGMSAEEFLRRWDACEFHDLFDHPDHRDLTHLVMIMPLVRPTR